MKFSTTQQIQRIINPILIKINDRDDFRIIKNLCDEILTTSDPQNLIVLIEQVVFHSINRNPTMGDQGVSYHIIMNMVELHNYLLKHENVFEVSSAPVMSEDHRVDFLNNYSADIVLRILYYLDEKSLMCFAMVSKSAQAFFNFDFDRSFVLPAEKGNSLTKYYPNVADRTFNSLFINDQHTSRFMFSNFQDEVNVYDYHNPGIMSVANFKISNIACMIFCGNYLVFGTKNGAVCILDQAGKTKLLTKNISLNNHAICAMVKCDDNEFISLSRSGSIVHWEIISSPDGVSLKSVCAAKLAILKNNIAFNPKNTSITLLTNNIIAIGGNALYVFDLSNRKQLTFNHSTSDNIIAIASVKGTILAITENEEVQTYCYDHDNFSLTMKPINLITTGKVKVCDLDDGSSEAIHSRAAMFNQLGGGKMEIIPGDNQIQPSISTYEYQHFIFTISSGTYLINHADLDNPKIYPLSHQDEPSSSMGIHCLMFKGAPAIINNKWSLQTIHFKKKLVWLNTDEKTDDVSQSGNSINRP